LDLQTISIDSIAMGYPDTYEAAITAFTDQMANSNHCTNLNFYLFVAVGDYSQKSRVRPL